ncbi:MAG: TRAP transporter substrate-binding protein [Alphaproteobacteria bacterium]
MTSFRRVLALTAFAGALVFAGAAQAQTTIKVGLALPKGLPGFDHVNGMYETFGREVEAASKGELKVDLAYGGSLGNPNDRMNQMRRGIIQMSDASDGKYAAIHPDIQVFSLPYMFPTEQAAWKVFDGPAGTAMAEDIRKKTGIRVLGWWEAGGFRHFSSNKPIRTVADFGGLKVRALGPANAKPVEAAGGIASAIPFNELYTSLKTGVVDAQDNSVSVFRLVKLYEVQKFLTLSGHSYSFGPMGINDAFYEKLSPAHKKIVDEAAKKAVAYNRETSRKIEGEALAFVKQNGVTVIEMTAAAKEEMRAKMQPAVRDWLLTQISSPKVLDDALAAVKAAQ